jgi:imidazolonepropionase-like amidohydrolase
VPDDEGARSLIRARNFICAALVVLAAAASVAHSQSKSEDVVALVGGRVISSPDAEPVDGSTVIIADSRIVEVGPKSRVKIPSGAKTIDCSGLTIVPGFQNSHVHFTEEKWANAKTRPAALLTSGLEAMLMRYGFTTVVDTASLLPNTVELRWRIETGEVKGPRILTAGLALYPPNGVPYYVKDSVPPALLKLLPQPATPAAAAEIVRMSAEGGANLVKLFTGSVVRREPGGVRPMPADVASAAVVEAHRRGLLVFAHPSNVAGLQVALDAHVDVLAHAVEDTDGFTPNHLKRMRSQNVGLIPTLTLLAGDGRRDMLDQVRDYARLGGQILFGTDVGYLTDYDPVREYQLMESAGLNWRQILASLTTNPANRFKENTRRGRVARGMDADLVVLGADPSRGSQAFVDVRYTIREGRVLYERR